MIPIRVSTSTTVYTHAQRAAKGTFWPDGMVGFIGYSGPNVTGFSADGSGNTYKTVGPPSDFAASSTPVAIGSPPAGTSYAGGGPVIDCGSGVLAMVTHFERWPGGDGTKFWSSLGISRSADGGSSWTNLGETLQTALPYNAGANYLVDTEGGAVVPAGAYYYLYFKEAVSDTSYYQLYQSVARCDRAAFHAAVIAGTVPTFSKWTGGTTWSAAGLGGTGSALPGLGAPLNPYTLSPAGTTRALLWADFWHHRGAGVFVCFGPDLPTWQGAADNSNSVYRTAFSRDGLNWYAGADVTDPGDYYPGNLYGNYATILPDSVAGNRSGSGPMTAYYQTGQRWSNVAVRSRVVTPVTGPRRTPSNKFRGGPAASVYR